MNARTSGKARLSCIAAACGVAVACAGNPEKSCPVSFSPSSIRIGVGATETVAINKELILTTVSVSTFSENISTELASNNDSVDVTCHGVGSAQAFVKSELASEQSIDPRCGVLNVECERALSWDTPLERLAVGTEGVAGLVVNAEDGDVGELTITADPDGPVYLVRADVGPSISMPMFSDYVLSYRYTHPPSLHLIQLGCLYPDTTTVRAEGKFVPDGNSWLDEVSNDMDLQVECFEEGGTAGTGGTSGSGGTAGSGGNEPFRFVHIADLEPGGTTSGLGTAGVDIDAVEVRVGGQSYFAGEVRYCTLAPGGDNSLARDCDQALGTPGGTCEVCDTSSGQCSSFVADFISLGGDDRANSGIQGELSVSIEGLDVIPSGAEITVHECGSTQNPVKVNERYEILVGSSHRPQDPGRVTCLADAIGTASCTVP